MNDVPQLEPILVTAARAFWPAVRADLETIRARYDERWLPDDVWHEIMVGNAYLWAAGGAEAPEAWVIVQVMARPYDRSLHIWSAAEHTTARVADYWPQILAMAADAGCSHVTIETPRRWERALPGLSVRYLYSCEV